METKKEHGQEKESFSSEEKNIDSPINTRNAAGAGSDQSLTQDESADTDPNDVANKASFSDNSDKGKNDTGRFDGNIGI